MKKFITFIFILLQVGFLLETKGFASNEGVDIIPLYEITTNGTQLRNPNIITADITSHILSITINENIGITQIMIRDANGAMVALDNMMSSPNTTCIYISNTGYYRIDIILSNGDIYYGYFTVYDGITI